MTHEPTVGRVATPVTQLWEYSFPERERDRYVSRSLGYVVLLNGAAALILMAVMALNPESASHRLAWAMMVFASGAIAGLASSLLAYMRRLFAISLPTHVFIRDFLRVGAIVLAVAAGAAFLTGMNMVSLTVPEGSTTRMKSKPENPAPSQTKPENPAPSPPENPAPSQTKPENPAQSPTGHDLRFTSKHWGIAEATRQGKLTNLQSSQSHDVIRCYSAPFAGRGFPSVAR